MYENSYKQDNNKRQLFLFHFAGGSSYSFEFMKPFLADFEVIALELPGRGNRIKESLTENFEEAAWDFFRQILKLLRGSNFVFYGHSLGALFAFRLCQLLEERNIFPAYIVVTGNPGPGIVFGKNLNELEKDDFVSELKKLGGIPQAILEDADSLNYFLPILRSDFGIADNKNFKINGVINTPIYALMGNKEDSVNEITNWEKFTTRAFKCKILDGNHFFIYEQVERIAKVIQLFD